MISNGTNYGQLTPQRINWDDTKGIFFTDKQEEQLLKIVVDYDYVKASLERQKEISNTLTLRILDKEYEIKKASEQITLANERTTECLSQNSALNLKLVAVRDSLSDTQDKLTVSKRNNWIFGGISVFLFSSLIYTITH
jgi:septal ring factor EnvC (AmiA/AmiB activator)